MRIYKIINEKKFEGAKTFLAEVNRQGKENIDIVSNKVTPFKWKKCLVQPEGFQLLPTYMGFVPETELTEVPEGWMYDKKFPTVLVPNKRTKIGKQAVKDIKALQNFAFYSVYLAIDIDVELTGKFTLPAYVVAKDNSEIYLVIDDRVKLEKKDFEEVTVSYVEEMTK